MVLIFEREDFMSTRFRWTTQRSGANWGFNAFQLKIALGKLTFDAMFILHRVVWGYRRL